jgi:hypothetical protein
MDTPLQCIKTNHKMARITMTEYALELQEYLLHVQVSDLPLQFKEELTRDASADFAQFQASINRVVCALDHNVIEATRQCAED